MNQLIPLLALAVSLAAAQTPASISGAVTDPSGAAISGAAVELRGSGVTRHVKTGNTGEYSIRAIAPGKYELVISAKGFAPVKKTIVVDGSATFEAQLAIEPLRNTVNVNGGGSRVSVDPDSNGGAVVMRQRQIAALSDDPDELALQLQALAGPAPGPNGGQFFVDGFTAGNLPPKSAIREIRINANPFSAEYDRPGFGRVEIFTKPGSQAFHGQVFAQYNGGFLDSRNPLVAESAAPPYRAQSYGANLGGPLRKNRASFTLDAEIRRTRDDAFVLATVLDANLAPLRINQTVPAPQKRVSASPRLDYSLGAKNTLTARYQDIWSSGSITRAWAASIFHRAPTTSVSPKMPFKSPRRPRFRRTRRMKRAFNFCARRCATPRTRQRQRSTWWARSLARRRDSR